MVHSKSALRLGVQLTALALMLAPAAPALAQGAAPKLAPGVATSSDFTAPSESYVAAVDSPLFADRNVYGKVVGAVKRGEKLNVLAEAQDHDWLLIGRKGVGVGYLPRSLATPAKYAPQLTHWQG